MMVTSSPPRADPAGQGRGVSRPPGEAELLGPLLRSVSRSFYLTLRVLPADLRLPIGTAYLLARAADTIADTRALPAAQRLQALQALRGQVLAGTEESRQGIEALGGYQRDEDEQYLLASMTEIMRLFQRLEPLDQERVRRVVVTLTAGMTRDLEVFPAEQGGTVCALASSDELDRYIYLVAGCVGAFWTDMLEAHVPAVTGWDSAGQRQRGIQFGKALQLTNILRDLPRDLRMGRCYLPAEQLIRNGLSAWTLLDPACSAQARPVLTAWLQAALDHYRQAQVYVLAIPRRCWRLRLAAVWPLAIGLGTLHALAVHPQWLDPERVVKLSRPQIYRIMLVSLPRVLSNRLLEAWLGRLRRRVEGAL